MGLAHQGIDKARHHHGDLVAPSQTGTGVRKGEPSHAGTSTLGSLAGIKGWAGSIPPPHLCLFPLSTLPHPGHAHKGRLLSGE